MKLKIFCKSLFHKMLYLLNEIFFLFKTGLRKRKSRIHFVTFASSSCTNTLKRIRQEALSSGFFDTVTCLRESDLPNDYKQKYNHLLNENVRGYGYWMWKSFVTKNELQKIPEGDILVYIDAGCTINVEGEKRFREYLKMLQRSTYSNLSFQLGNREKQYTKGDALKYFGVENTQSIKDSGQLIATAYFIRKDRKSEKIVDEWYSVCHNNKKIIDDSTSDFPNDPEFIEHRFDQSIFSLVRKMNGSLIIQDETWFVNWSENKRFPIHGTRLKYIKYP